MINIEIDGKKVTAENGHTIIQAAHQAGIAIPHFCYHKKLSVAANCRMCLVQVEKAPKPLPACATPVSEGMKVLTNSAQAVKAQNGVMEFLLINHPLDCPICDQGGECMLQDMAVGYGASASRYQEEKRVVQSKDLGPLVCAEEMSRCINCTRCVRFGIEIGGQMELGQAFRGEHAEILSFVGGAVESELSGNMIDLCPVGALTSKPFRYTARSWELSRRRSVSPHDGLGSGLAVQTKNNRVMRVLPIENEAINECWLSDKDRFSYEGLNAPERLTRPMIRKDGHWQEAGWQEALEFAANGLRHISSNAGPEHVGALATPHSTLEELFLLQKMLRAMGSDNVDFRLRHADFSADGKRAGAPWLGMSVAELAQADRFLVVGSFLRKDHPLLAARMRQAVRRGAQLNIIHSADDDLLMKVANQSIVAPDALVDTLAQLAKDVAAKRQDGIAASLLSGQRVVVLLGNFAEQHPHAAQLQALAQQIAQGANGKFGFLGAAANSVGGYIADFVPTGHGLNAAAMLSAPRKAYILLNTEPELDCANPQQAIKAMHAADLVIALSAYKHQAMDYADVLLPIAPFSETSGTYISTEGRVQSFKGAVKPLGEARPGWKVLRVLANLVDVDGFGHDASEQVRDEALRGVDVGAELNNALTASPAAHAPARAAAGEFQRVADVPIYSADAVVRRAKSLQATHDAAEPVVRLHGEELKQLGVAPGAKVKVSQGEGSVLLTVAADDGMPRGAARVAAGHGATAGLGAMFGTIKVERA
jgi:NADH-quinone oxidoreductase subunit G